MRQAEALNQIIDTTDAVLMMAELEDGSSLSKASMLLTLRQYKREDFTKFREQHGEAVTGACIAIIAARF